MTFRIVSRVVRGGRCARAVPGLCGVCWKKSTDRETIKKREMSASNWSIIRQAVCGVFAARRWWKTRARLVNGVTWRGVESKCLWFFNKLLSDVSDAWIYDPLKFDSVV